MGERKVLNKYYPPDFDPAKLPKGKRRETNEMKVRMMLPMSVRCKTCGTFMYKGTKFNTRKEDVMGENYLGIQVFRFYYRCKKCAAEFCMKTDPKNADYVLEAGATRNYEPWRDEEATKKEAVAKREEEEMGNAMKALENRTLDSKREMDIMAALDEMKALNAQHARVSTEQALAALQQAAAAQQLEEEDAADVAAFYQLRAQANSRRLSDEEDDDEGDGEEGAGAGPGPGLWRQEGGTARRGGREGAGGGGAGPGPSSSSAPAAASAGGSFGAAAGAWAGPAPSAAAAAAELQSLAAIQQQQHDGVKGGAKAGQQQPKQAPKPAIKVMVKPKAPAALASAAAAAAPAPTTAGGPSGVGSSGPGGANGAPGAHPEGVGAKRPAPRTDGDEEAAAKKQNVEGGAAATAGVGLTGLLGQYGSSGSDSDS